MATTLFPTDVTMTPAAQKLHDPAAVVEPSLTAPLDLTVFVSCYNERDYINSTIETSRSALNEIGSIRYEIIVVDDCSKDGSGNYVKDYIAAHPDDRLPRRLCAPPRRAGRLAMVQIRRIGPAHRHDRAAHEGCDAMGGGQ